MQDNYSKETWIKEIEDYCQLVGITPQVLIECHKMANKKLVVKGGKVVVNDLTKPKVVGQPYNAFDNPLYKNKMSDTSKFKKDQSMIPVWKLHQKFNSYWKYYKHKDLFEVCKSLCKLCQLKLKDGSINTVRNNWAKVCSFLIEWEGKKC